jgi:hypothetical protein
MMEEIEFSKSEWSKTTGIQKDGAAAMLREMLLPAMISLIPPDI